MDDVELRRLVPRIIAVLVRRGADFATATMAQRISRAKRTVGRAEAERDHQNRQAARLNQMLKMGGASRP